MKADADYFAHPMCRCFMGLGPDTRLYDPKVPAFVSIHPAHRARMQYRRRKLREYIAANGVTL